MKLLFLFPLFLAYDLSAQSFEGLWRGSITRDYGNEIKTDTIELHLLQTGDKITGFSQWYESPGVYIKANLEGSFNKVTNLLRLTETSIDFNNLPNRTSEFFLDRYLLTYDENDKLILAGKSVSCDRKTIYTRSKMIVKRKQVEITGSGTGDTH